MKVGFLPAFIAGLLAVFLATSVQASPESRALVEQGAVAMKARDYKTALEKFDAAVSADPNDLTALFFQGAALNRLGRGAEALPKLADAQRRGLKRADLHLESGYAHVQMRDWSNALTRLQRYEVLEPGKGITQELLGSAYFGSGKLEEAQKAFTLAAQRDPALKPTSELYLARIAARQGNRQEADDRVAGILRDAPESSAGRLVRQLQASPVPGKPFTFNAAFGVGYNTNVIGLGEGLFLPLDITRKSASFERVQLNPTYTLRPDAQSALTLGYGFTGDFYNGLSAVNLADHALSATYTRRLNDGMSMRLRGGAQYTLLGGNSYRDGYTGSAALGWRLDSASTVEVAAGAGSYDYRFAPLVAAQNRDGKQYSLSPTYYRTLGSSARLRVGYAYSIYRADGQDFSYHSNAVNAGVTADLGNRVTGDFAISYSRDRYDNPNSAATFVFSRSDDIAGIGAQLVRPIDETWRVFAQAGYVRANSNILFYNYRQATTLFGVAASF